MLILGFGKEGRSTLAFLERHCNGLEITIADQDEGIAGWHGLQGLQVKNSPPRVPHVSRDMVSGQELGLIAGNSKVVFRCGPGYLDHLDDHDVIIKSPGVKLSAGILKSKVKLTSQTDLFLNEFRDRVIGITGTKGKSTTTSLVYHLLKVSGKKSVLTGNIGIPPLDCYDEALTADWIAMELSSAQLEDIRSAPHIGVILNLFPEHLDRYGTESKYYQAKLNLLKQQVAEDIFIFNDDDPVLGDLIAKNAVIRNYKRFSLDHPVDRGGYLLDEQIILRDGEKPGQIIKIPKDMQLRGRHNTANILAASLCCLESGLPASEIEKGIGTFHPLEHRLEYVGNFAGVDFYNDSIATIPEATINAVTALKKVDILILGGFDRGLDYEKLYRFLDTASVQVILFTGDAGKRMLDEYKKRKQEKMNLCFARDYEEIFKLIREKARPGMLCLLSPAAASYDQFANFEERGRKYKKMASEF